MAKVVLRLVAALLAMVVTLAGCSGADVHGLTGNYVDDTIAVIAELRQAVEVSVEDPGYRQVERESRDLMNDYISRYRRDPRVKALGSFTTMQTAVNGLAGHYANFENRPVPEKLRNRLQKEWKVAELSVVRGA
ncbi:MAG: photosystem II protein Psb27 [Synechococcus sp. SB0668_bin_15]|nr:photosystem II protein Psb27 [Synechococcus sp. SB0668_bin_15]MXZ82590.1 photosystem II protein Psb27 [Synechococcus sp. SB0666_bin_14]MYA90531.1 photosystem II protein Psb27 [Synechococcus sp. SB0663_bin_10]MYC50551.1 photosystem II protein Psb27 [Synechococcus sp. SB0662_bin_14]MYG46023.1 photosystem II protein Psb27 [Synechococcus sp. SB0675_bin_6]MYJ59101.1 photosystem II protein Psb27 [Synechococcus sp. SB0672_bin_6]MYK91039.1 photosystem II protein Psb27 [Synechococcus sp. SB0669_bin